MLIVCARCHRPLRRAPVNGLGPVCARLSTPPTPVERDLFGYDIDKAAEGAQALVMVELDAATAGAHAAIRAQFRAARMRLGVWS